MTTGHEFGAAQVHRAVGLELTALEKREFRRYADFCMTGRRAPSMLTIRGPVLDEGQVLFATDRAYRVTSSGWRRVDTADELPAHRSQIRLLPVTKGKYPRVQVEAAKDHETPRSLPPNA